MEKQSFVVSVTGSAGNIGSLLLFEIPKLGIFETNQRVELRLFDLPGTQAYQEGLVLELEDAFPTQVSSIKILEESAENFRGTDLLIMLSGVPRATGQERKDLIGANVSLFKRMALMVNETAKPDLRVLIVANPCCTNAFVFSKHAPNISRSNIHALLRLDFNRALSYISHHPSVRPFNSSFEGLRIFGNHSKSVVVDFSEASVLKDGVRIPVTELVSIEDLKDIQEKVRERGMEIIHGRGKSAGSSAAQAIVDHINDWYKGSSKVVAVGTYFEELAGIKAGVWLGLPVNCHGRGDINTNFEPENIPEEILKDIKTSIEELKLEKRVALRCLEERGE
mgnify:CR=1 FL=1